jgi:hypothetical protein
MASLGEFPQVLQLLKEARQFDLAALFGAACLENNLLNLDSSRIDTWVQTPTLSTSESPVITSNTANPTKTVGQLLESVHLEYGSFLQKIDCLAAAQFYLTKAGKEGQPLLEALQKAK